MMGGASDHVVGPFAFQVIVSLGHRPASPAANDFLHSVGSELFVIKL
jgi:hypothetical protein